MLDFGYLVLAREEYKIRLEDLEKGQSIGKPLPGVRIRLLQGVGNRLVALGARLKQQPMQRAGVA